MADSRRWTTGGVRRDDQFTRPPAFRDGVDSPPLSPQASWHGSASQMQVAFAVGLALLAAVGAVAFMLLSDGGAGPVPSGSAAQGADPPADAQVEVPGAAGNATSSLPPAPSLPTAPVPLP